MPVFWVFRLSGCVRPVATFFGFRRPQTLGRGALEDAAATSEVVASEGEASASQDDPGSGEAASQDDPGSGEAASQGAPSGAAPAAVPEGHDAALSPPTLPIGEAGAADEAAADSVPEAAADSVPEAAADATAAALAAPPPLPLPRRPVPDGTAVVSSQPRTVLPHAQVLPRLIALPAVFPPSCAAWQRELRIVDAPMVVLAAHIQAGRSLNTDHICCALQPPQPSGCVKQSLVTALKHCRMFGADITGVAASACGSGACMHACMHASQEAQPLWSADCLRLRSRLQRREPSRLQL